MSGMALAGCHEYLFSVLCIDHYCVWSVLLQEVIIFIHQYKLLNTCSAFDSDRLQNYTTTVQHCLLFCIYIALKLQAVSTDNVNNNMCCVWNWKQCECVCSTSQYLGCSKFPMATTGSIVLLVAPVPFASLDLESLRQQSQCTWNV